jgi:hypothetical protein
MTDINECDRCTHPTSTLRVELEPFFSGYLCDQCRADLRQFFEHNPATPPF